MSKNTDKPMFYFRLDAGLIEKLDRKIHRLGYASRAEFFTAVSYAVLLGTLADETTNQTSTIQGQSGLSQHLPTLPDSLKIWMEKSVPKISEEQILSDLQTIIRENLFPVIAMKGKDIAFTSTWKDIRDIYREQTGIWVTESDLKEAYTAFDAVNRTELIRYREEQMEYRTNQE